MKQEKSQVTKKQVKLAVSALSAHLESKPTKRKDQLFESDQSLWLIFSFKKVPQVNGKPKKIPLPHSPSDKKEICFISSQPGKIVKGKFLAAGIDNITKVISLTKLRKEYKSFKLKRELCSSFDVFLCDEKIYHLVCKSLGKEFFKHKKDPLPINMSSSDLKSEIGKSLQCTLLRMGHGPCSALRVGCLKNQSENEIIDNIIHAIKVSVSKIPGQWKNVQKIHVKSSSTVALPIYNGLDSITSDDDISDEETTPKTKKVKFDLEANNTSSIDNNDADKKKTKKTIKKKKKVLKSTKSS